MTRKRKPLTEERRRDAMRANGYLCPDCLGRILLVDGFGVCEMGCAGLIVINRSDRDELGKLERVIEKADLRKFSMEG